MLLYLKQQGCQYSGNTMISAAVNGFLAVCQFLLEEQCPHDAKACLLAARRGRLETVRLLHEQGCPIDIQEVRMTAAAAGHLPVLMYAMSAEPAASAAQLTEMLNAAGANNHLSEAKWLRQAGAEWPAVLRHNRTAWKTDVLQWARAEGCTSPVSV
jgi:hypothetical protein